jgi:hypothetical protein
MATEQTWAGPRVATTLAHDDGGDDAGCETIASTALRAAFYRRCLCREMRYDVQRNGIEVNLFCRAAYVRARGAPPHSTADTHTPSGTQAKRQQSRN